MFQRPYAPRGIFCGTSQDRTVATQNCTGWKNHLSHGMEITILKYFKYKNCYTPSRPLAKSAPPPQLRMLQVPKHGTAVWTITSR